MIDPRQLTATGRLQTRQATTRDRPFALGLYLATTEQVLGSASGWDESYTRTRFGVVYRRKESWVVHDRDGDVGWLQVRPGQRRVILHQIHLLPAHTATADWARPSSASCRGKRPRPGSRSSSGC